MKLVVTTTQSKAGMNNLLDEFLAATNLDFAQREGRSIEQLQHNYDVDGVIVWHKEGPILYIGEQKFYFHPSMAKNRISMYRKFNTMDPLVKACAITGADKLLDCTLGLGADAIVASYFNPDG